ncbi:DMT family transporter [Arachnia propionica]|uniref:EamA family transporter n=1 Tax=Arachnia propionica TaxID=1750 RepID=A0A3P1WXD8_9ACTN|nr:EamA family transporter [Arachnia propionica]RRD51219.1 EamA family transporter [Arachnia propionica]
MNALLGRIPAVVLVLAAIVSVQLGSSLAKGLFTAAPPLVAAWLRVTGAALLLGVIVRPRLTGRTPAQWRLVIAHAVCLTGMNAVFYEAIRRIPVGMAVTFEFLGPLLVAILTTRRRSDWLWALLAAVGVAMLGFSPEPLDPVGVVFALTAGGCWALYIMLTPRLAEQWEGFTGLATGMALGTVLLGPLAVLATPGFGPWYVHPSVWVMGLGLGLLSSALPYGLELRALERMPRSTFGILMALEPAAAALVAWGWLGESLGWHELAAMTMVIAASVGTVVSARRDPSG